jgi:electron transfer flavoprotein beta subunit
VLTVTAGVFEPRYPSLKGIMAAKSKPVDRLTAADLGIEPKSGEEVVSVQPAEERKAGEIVEDDGTAAERIVAFLAAQKVI